MYAIVEIAGQQFKVERGVKVYVHRLDANEGAKVQFDKVLLVDNGGKVQVGTPSIDGATVAATVLGHVKGDKVIVFKKKRRKGYQKSNGHRQQFTQLLIQGILGKGETLKDEIAYEKKAPRPSVEKAERRRKLRRLKKQWLQKKQQLQRKQHQRKRQLPKKQQHPKKQHLKNLQNKMN